MPIAGSSASASMSATNSDFFIAPKIPKCWTVQTADRHEPAKAHCTGRRAGAAPAIALVLRQRTERQRAENTGYDDHKLG